MKKLLKLAFILTLPFFAVACDGNNDKSTAEINEEMDEMKARHKAELEKEFAENGTVSPETESRHHKERMEYLEATSEQTSGDQAKILKAIADAMKESEELSSKLSAPDKEFEDAFDYGTIKTVEDTEKKIKKLEEYAGECDKYLEFIRNGYPERIRKGLEDEGIKSADVSKYMRQIKRNIKENQDLVEQYQIQERKIVDGVTAQLKLLKNNHGKWEWDAKEEVPLFEDSVEDAVIDAFNAQYDAIYKASQKQSEIEEKLIQVQ